MEQKTILLVEDDFLNRRQIKKVLLENGYQIFEAKNASEAFAILNKEALALTIVDINLGEDQQDGISIGTALQKKYALPFIYLTAYDTEDIMSRALASAPQAFLTKPFKNIDLLASVELAIRQFNYPESQPSLIVKDGEYNVKLPLNDVFYIEAEGNYLLFYTAQKTYKKRSTIRQIMEALPLNMFIQTHRAYVVNKHKIYKFGKRNLVVNNQVIPVSKNYVDDDSLLPHQ